MRVSLWNPYRMMNRMSGLMDDDIMNFDWDATELDMYEEEDKVVVKLKAPGFDEKNVDITIEDNSVTITGTSEVKQEEEDKAKKYYRKEIRNQSFTRTVTLPSKVVADKASAKFKSGILTLELPKAEESKPKKISIKPEE